MTQPSETTSPAAMSVRTPAAVGAATATMLRILNPLPGVASPE